MYRQATRTPTPVRADDHDGSSMTNRLLTADEVADRLGVGVKWVWAQARAGTIPHVRLGRYKRFRSEAIDAWIAQLEVGGAD
jgi:excisionase family DNA binding protein